MTRRVGSCPSSGCLCCWRSWTFKDAYDHGRWADTGFAALNAVLAAYAIVAFVGVRTSLVDIWISVVSWLYKPQRYEPAPSRRAAPASVSSDAQLADWEMVLYLGFADRRRAPRAPVSAEEGGAAVTATPS